MLTINYKYLLFFLLFKQFLIAQMPPIANDDFNSTFINLTLNEPSPGLLNNDTDSDGDELAIIYFSINNVSYDIDETITFSDGSILISADGGYTFTPKTDFTGSVFNIRYTISDGSFTSSAILRISVLYPPEPPVANDDTITVFNNATLNESSPGLLLNDTDINGDTLLITEYVIDNVTYSVGETVSFNEGGSITIYQDGGYTFIPDSNFSGDLSSIRYTITDGGFDSSANFNISVLYPPEPPIANDDYDTVDINTTLSVANPGVLANDTDINEDEITVLEFSINNLTYNVGQTADFAEGSFTLSENGAYTFIPAPDYIGDVPIISYKISDGFFTNFANLYLTVEPVDDLLEIKSFTSCNQSFTETGEYKIRYDFVLKNKSNARDFHESSFIKNIDLNFDFESIFGNGCLVEVDEIDVRHNNVPVNYVNSPYPEEFDKSAVNNNFLAGNSISFFSNSAIQDLILYPRQTVYVRFCVTVNAFCGGRPNPTPSGSGIDFESILNITTNNGIATKSLLLKDFHTTEAILIAGLYSPEFSNRNNFPGIINPDGTYKFTNTVVVTNKGTGTANNVNYNMGLGHFIEREINFREIKVEQSSGPSVVVNNSYNGETNTDLLLPNNSLGAGETITLNVSYIIEPIKTTELSYFYQISKSQSQGIIDDFDESTANNKQRYSFVTWSDNLGDHLDRYFPVNSLDTDLSSISTCSCSTTGMLFSYTSSSITNKIIFEEQDSPNGILEHQEFTFRTTIQNTSESVQLQNLQLEDDLTSICGGNILSVSTTPTILNSSANVNPTPNPNFDGVSDKNIFDGSSGLLKANEVITIQYTVLINENCIGQNTTSFSATDPLNNIISSSSSININAATDTDNDGINNEIDIDDDNDTILDILEYNGLNPIGDNDSDNIPNYRDVDFGTDSNNDGIIDIFDFDNDGVPNHFDLDNDNDGILDIVEVGNASSDANSNGRTNNPVGLNGLDNTKELNDSSVTLISYIIENTDAEGNPNYLDIDSDGDGIVDNIEAQATNNFKTLNDDVSIAGINTVFPNGISPIDTDNDAIFDYVDINSDNDIRNDIIEGWDTNSDGVPEVVASNLDIDNDGLDDAFDNNTNLVNPTNGQTPLSFPNVDNVDNPERDWREIIAVIVKMNNVAVNESQDLVFTLSLVTKNDNNVLIESASPINITFSSSDGSDTTDIYDVATSPFDYPEITDLIFTIPPLTKEIDFSASTIEDDIFEQNELFTVIGTITSNNTINEEFKGIGTILDNDTAPTISINNVKEFEGVNLSPTISISHPSSTPIQLNVNTDDDIAVSPEDYTSTSEDLTINGTIDPNNANLQVSFNISTELDNLNEFDEESLNIVAEVTSENVINKLTQGKASILDIDPNPFISIDNNTVKEGNELVFTISLLNEDNELMENHLPISMTLETIDDSAISIEDYEYLNKVIEFPALTSSISQVIKTLDDNKNEEIESFLLEVNIDLSNVSNTSFPNGVGLIQDDDYTNLFSPNSDGKSDLFKISGIVEDYPNFKIQIFNRQGNQIYNYNNNGNMNPVWWDGNFKGNPSPVGVYYYILDFNDGIKKPLTSFIQLIR